MNGQFNPNLTRPVSFGHLGAGILGLTSIYALRVLTYFLARMIYRQFIYGMQVLIDGFLHLMVVILSVVIIIPMIAFSGAQVQRAIHLYKNQIAPSSCRYVDQMLLAGSLIATGLFLVLTYLSSSYHILELQVSLVILASIGIANAMLLWFTLRIPKSAERLDIET
jgi:hypothetical protein